MINRQDRRQTEKSRSMDLLTQGDLPKGQMLFRSLNQTCQSTELVVQTTIGTVNRTNVSNCM